MEVTVTEKHSYSLNDDAVEEMLALAERLRSSNGGVLDESAIQAVAEATGAPTEYVRLAVKVRAEKEKLGILSRIRAQYLTLDPEIRGYVFSAVLGIGAAFMNAIDWGVASLTRTLRSGSSFGLFAMVSIILGLVALYNVAFAKDAKSSFFGGALFGGVFCFALPLFGLIFGMTMDVHPWSLIPALVGGGLIGLASNTLVGKYRKVLGLKDPSQERQDLLRQLVDLQSKLREGEQSITFLSADVVGSTRMKEVADALAVEFTFTEYHSFVDNIVRKHGGRVHSTAGDGITCAFEDPQQGFIAARNIMAGLFELNAFRNKIGVPIELRIGLHTGMVVMPKADDVRSVNFAHVIDIAAHLQKVAPRGAVVVSDSTAAHIVGGPATIGPDRVHASGVEGTVWIPKQISLPSSVSSAPVSA